MFGRDGFNLFYFLYYPHHHVYFIHLKISKKKNYFRKYIIFLEIEFPLKRD
jgi:hypothetical protein